MTTRFQCAIEVALILSLVGATACAASFGLGTPEASHAWLVAQMKQPWTPKFDPKTSWNFTHADAKVQQQCLSSAAIPIAQSDVPAAAQIFGLAKCNSEALYYGFTGKADYARARACAFLERANGNRRPVSGSAVLSMVYANGLGVQRNLPLATKFACEEGGAPAEIDGRVGHLESLDAMKGPQVPPFDFCDDITSGRMDGVCTGVAATYRDAQRNAMISHIASSYTSTQQAAFSALQQAAASYFGKHAVNEVNLVGTMRDVYWILDFEYNWNEFLADLQSLDADQLPAAGSQDVHLAETGLDSLLQRVLADPDLRQSPPRSTPPEGIPFTSETISKDGIGIDQNLWLHFRDAWLQFAAVRKPTLSGDTVQTWLTNQRIQNLRCLLPGRTRDATDCTRPSLLPSNMRQ